jgi:hypothetical protein
MLGLSGLSWKNEKQALRLESHSTVSAAGCFTVGLDARRARGIAEEREDGRSVALERCACPLLLPILQSRGQLGQYLRDQGFTQGVEVGVQRGDFARQLLGTWRDEKETRIPHG